MATLQRISNALFIYVLCGVIIAAFCYQALYQEEPCPLCYLQRLSMLGISIGLLMNLRFGVKMEHYGLCILSILLGRTVSIRQITLHICPQFPTFGQPVLGYDLYVWAFIVFSCSLIAIAILLILFGFSDHRTIKPCWGAWEITAFSLVALLLIANLYTTILDCGLTPCAG